MPKPYSSTTYYTVAQDRFVLKIAGESGQGINSIGEVFAKVFKDTGWSVFGYREYPSLIKGGYSCYQLDVSDHALRASSFYSDLLVCLSRRSVAAYLPTVRPGGVLLHSVPRLFFDAVQTTLIEERQLSIKYVPADQLAWQHGGKPILANTVMSGFLAQVLQVPLDTVKELVKAQFVLKPQLIDVNMLCLDKGYELKVEGVVPQPIRFTPVEAIKDQYLVNGNVVLGLGAVAAGVRAYFAYPMTPSSSVLTYLASIYHETGMLVRQVEDEISVAQMSLGSMMMGTRSLVATSGGGFDLMTESVSMAGMTEIPFVCILGQRPGPATGLPTWTATGDLNLALYAGHGEYARLVMAVSDPESCYELLQRAFNYAEKYQIPVILLTEKQVAESLFAIGELDEPLVIERSLVPPDRLPQLLPHDRYQLTPTGISPRWLPGQSPATFDANSDEHLEDGSLTEEASPVQAMYEKRLKKLEGLLAELPEPKLYGPAEARVTLIGWGSIKNAVLDALTILQKTGRQADGSSSHSETTFNYLHYEFIYPLNTTTIQRLAQAGQRLILVENNYFGQLGQLITQTTGYQFAKENRVLKYDGRPFFVEDILEVVAGV